MNNLVERKVYDDLRIDHEIKYNEKNKIFTHRIKSFDNDASIEAEWETEEAGEFSLYDIVDKYAEAFAKEGKSLFLSNSWDYQGGNRDGSSASTYGNCAYEDYLAWSAFDSAMHVEYVSYRRDGLAGNGVTKYSTDEKALYEIIRSGKKVGNGAEFLPSPNFNLPLMNLISTP